MAKKNTNTPMTLEEFAAWLKTPEGCWEMPTDVLMKRIYNK